MGNVAIRHHSTVKDERHHPSSPKFIRQEARRPSVSSSENYEDAPVEFTAEVAEGRSADIDLQALFHRVGEDAFTKAVLSFCVHMGGRLDSLDNTRLYDEFCSYTANHRPSLRVA